MEDSADFIFWLFADLDHVFVVTKLVSTYYGHYSGLLKRFWSGAVALSTAPAEDGTLLAVGSIPLRGDVRFHEVDFGYVPDRLAC